MYDSLNHFKSVSAHKLFIEAADQNYLLARWMLVNAFHQEFFWQATQAIEKYFKASLLTNDVSVSTMGHKLPDLESEHRKVFGDLAFARFCKPDALHSDFWRDEDYLKYLNRISRNGDPDGRYGLIGWALGRSELFKLDQLVFALRRLTVGLDWIVGGEWEVSPGHESFAGQTYRQALEADAQFLPRGLPGGLAIALRNPGRDRGDLLHAWNFEFSRNDDDLRKKAPPSVAPALGGFRNGFLFIHWDEIRRAEHLDPILFDGMMWLIDRIMLPRGEKEALRNELNRRK